MKKIHLIVGLIISLGSNAQLIELNQQVFGGSNDNYLETVCALTNNHLLVGSYTSVGNSGNISDSVIGPGDAWVYEMDENLNIVWDRCYGGDGDESFRASYSDENITLLGGYSTSTQGTGEKNSPSYGGNDGWLCKIDNQGNLLWDISLGGDSSDVIYSIEKIDPNLIVVGLISRSGVSGNKTTPSYGESDFWLVGIDTSGTILWQKSYGGSEGESIPEISMVQGGGFYLTGSSLSDSGTGNLTTPHFGLSDIRLFKCDNQGNILWQESYGGTDAESFPKLIEKDNIIHICASTFSPQSGNLTSIPVAGNFDSDILYLKLNPQNGSLISDLRFGGDANEEEVEMLVINDNEIIFTSSSSSNQGFDKSEGLYGIADVWMIAVDSNGTKLWDKTYGGSGFEINPHFITSINNVSYMLCQTNSPVSGNKTVSNFSTGTLMDVWIVAFNNVTNVNEVGLINQEFSLYPNPSNNSISIKSKSQIKALYIYSNQGKLVKKFNANYGNIDISNLSTGMYSILIETDEGVLTSRLMKN